MPSPAAYLLVEGNNDRHVIWSLCAQHGVLENFSVELPADDDGGIDILIEGLPVRLKAQNLKRLGIVVDADADLHQRWGRPQRILEDAGYSDTPVDPSVVGRVSLGQDLPRVGVWLMPNNQLPGILEDFVALLMPADDLLRPMADEVLNGIERLNLGRYPVVHRPKALIHTWLAWQETPGMPMGQAITARVLLHDAPVAEEFVSWLRNIFDS